MFVTLTPNPALDRVLRLSAPLTPRELHRVGTVREQAGGKGVNVSRVLRALGAEVATGRFGAQMKVSLTNDGPFTVLLEV